jgi:hypothetical protein
MTWYQKLWNTIKRLAGVAVDVAPPKYKAQAEIGKKVLDAIDTPAGCENDRDCDGTPDDKDPCPDDATCK